jgi:hypothetical protein
MKTEIITTKNGKKFKAETTDDCYYQVTSVDNELCTKACGYIINRYGRQDRVNGNMTPVDIAEYLSTRGF